MYTDTEIIIGEWREGNKIQFLVPDADGEEMYFKLRNSGYPVAYIVGDGVFIRFTMTHEEYMDSTITKPVSKPAKIVPLVDTEGVNYRRLFSRDDVDEG